MAVLLSAGAAELRFEDAWIRQPPPGARTAAGYVQIANAGAEPVSLVGVRSERFGGAMFHTTRVEDGVAKMRHLDAVDIAAGETWAFEPGAAHLMLFDPISPLQEGEEIVIHFETSAGASVEATFVVRRR